MYFRLVNFFASYNDDFNTTLRDLTRIKMDLEKNDICQKQEVDNQITYFLDKLGFESNPSEIPNINEQSYELATDVFLYASFCNKPTGLQFLQQNITCPSKHYNPKEMLIILNRLANAEKRALPYEKEFKSILKKVSNAWNLKYDDIRKLLGVIPCKGQDCSVSEELSSESPSPSPKSSPKLSPKSSPKVKFKVKSKSQVQSQDLKGLRT